MKGKTKNSCFWQFKNVSDSDTAELLLYGEISDVSWWGDEVTPKQFHEDLMTCEGKDLAVHINSPGGDVFAAQAIYTQLKNYPGKVTMYIDGMCASAATVIACAGDAVIMPSNTIYMIHNPKTGLLGYYDGPELDKVSASLTQVKQTIVNVYMARVKGALSEVQLKHKMDNEEWMTAETAKSYGFVDEIVDALPIENRLEGNVLMLNSVSCDLSRFQNAGRLREVLSGKGRERSDSIMNESEILQKIKNVLGIGEGQPQAEAPAGKPAEDKDAILAEERQRIAALDSMKDGRPVVDAIVEAAKANGATAGDIKPYIDAIPEEKPADKSVDSDMLAQIRNILQDNADSGATGVKPSPGGGPMNEAAQKAANIEDVASYANKLMEVK